MIAAEQVCVQIGAKKLLDDVSVTIPQGAVTAIVGPNGAGKSTLLKVLTGERGQHTGTVIMDGKRLGRWNVREQAKRRAVVPQHTSLNFPFLVQEVVLMGRMPHVRGVEKTRDWEIVQQVMERANVDHLAQRSYPTLSGGEQQRVHLARALAQIWDAPRDQPCYFFLDEPTASLDLGHQHEVLHVVQDLAKEGVAVVVILHDLNLAAQYADRIVVLCKGRVLAQGSPELVLTSSIIQQAYSIPVMVVEHPCQKCPMVVANPQRFHQPVVFPAVA